MDTRRFGHSRPQRRAWSLPLPRCVLKMLLLIISTIIACPFARTSPIPWLESEALAFWLCPGSSLVFGILPLRNPVQLLLMAAKEDIVPIHGDGGSVEVRGGDRRTLENERASRSALPRRSYLETSWTLGFLRLPKHYAIFYWNLCRSTPVVARYPQLVPSAPAISISSFID